MNEFGNETLPSLIVEINNELSFRKIKVNNSILWESQLVTCSIQVTYSDSFVYTPGSFGRAHPTPQETKPTKVERPFFTAVRGPPESP